MRQELKTRLPLFIGAALGVVGYLALLFSPLSLQADVLVHSFYEDLGLVDGDLVGLWKMLLVVLGAGLIFGSCYILLSSMGRGQKACLIIGLILIAVAFSPTLIVWGIIWSPMLVICSLLWSLLCTWMISLLTPKVSQPAPVEEPKAEEVASSGLITDEESLENDSFLLD